MEVDEVLIIISSNGWLFIRRLDGVGVGVGLGGRGQGVCWHGFEGAVEVVDGFDEVGGKALDGELARGFHVAFGALLQVAEAGDGAEVFVLGRRDIRG